MKNFCLLTVVAVVSSLLSSVPASAEVFELKTGHKLEGDVLKQQGDVLLVDIGVDVVKVPLSQIKSRRASQESANTPAHVKKHQLYRTAQLPRRSVKELTEKYGEGVVLVQTPGGLGSGFIVNENGFCVTNYHVVEKETRIAATIYHRGKCPHRGSESVLRSGAAADSCSKRFCL
jgi:serine protease Do